MIFGVQILGVIFGFLMIYLSFLYYKRKEFSKLQFLSWELLWILFLSIVFFPEIISGFTKKFGFIRLMDFLVIIAFIIITFLTFCNYISLNRIKKGLEKKVREDALKGLDH